MAMQFGSFFTDRDVTRGAKVAVLGSVARDHLFGPGADPTGRLSGSRTSHFQIVGVLTSKGQAAMGQDQEDGTLPSSYTTMQKKLLGMQHLNNITVSAQDGVPLDTMTPEISALLRTRHRIQPGAGRRLHGAHARGDDEHADVDDETRDLVLPDCRGVAHRRRDRDHEHHAGVSVTERTREIGLRLSVGARDIDVLLQFLWSDLSEPGGRRIGIGLGFASPRL